MDPKVTKKGEGEILIEGGEISEIHAMTDKLIFSVGVILTGKQESLDKGHKGSDEICYVISGSIVINLPGIKKCYLLNEGDSILIPPGESHYAINVGEKNAVTIWACAPKL